eukprot:snap_masked-scaffold_3-processed-gene-15.38-mRNA-1 protein AED:0.02 eAED:0.02 QI:0/-1/0/1/-1/1/1/0/118
MIPVSLLKSSQNQQLLVQLRDGESYIGTLKNCDVYMNINLEDVTLTSADGSSFFHLDEIYIRGPSIKYLRLNPDLLKEVQANEEKFGKRYTRGRGGRARGRTRGSFRGRGKKSRGRGN